MSSTNRGYARHKSDYYITPVDQVVEFLNAFLTLEPDAFDGIILDPCGGGDDDNPMSYPKALSKVLVEPTVRTIDIRKDSLADIKADYLTYEVPFKPSVVITNPPFNLAEPIIKKALCDVHPGGFVVMLLRLNFYGGQKRNKSFWREVGLPKYTFVHHKRMSFTDSGKTDSIEYAHFVWQRGVSPKHSLLSVI